MTRPESMVMVVVDARKADAGLAKKVHELVKQHPGDAACVLQLLTSVGERRLLFKEKVEPSEAFYGRIRELGWSAVPIKRMA